MRLLSCNEMKQVEQFAAKYGLSYQRMMENAGSACARNILNNIDSESGRKQNIVVVCGKGNNGGDGFVIARKFAENGFNVSVILASGYPQSQEAIYMYKMVIDLSIPTIWYDADKLKTLQTLKNADVIVDAVFGFGFYGNISEELKSLFAEMNSSGAVKFAVDVPSGVYCDSGFKDECCFVADYTIAISALKPCHIVHPASDCCGDIIIANIGISADSYTFVKNSMFTYSKAEIGNLLLKRDSTAHKGDFGHLLSICGSKNMPGAPVLAASSALRSGVGLVTAAFPEGIYNPISMKLTEALLFPLPETEQGTVSCSAIDKIFENIQKYSAILIGCGLSVTSDTKELVYETVRRSTVPLIIDADGINVIAENINVLREAKAPVILTPHPKEMSRLCGVDVSLIQSDRVKYASEFAKLNNVTVVLKGSNTVVASPVKESVYINSSGNSGLAKGGSGDVLAGIISAFCAQGMNADNASCAGVYIHGHSADRVADNYSQAGMIPTDVINELSRVFGEFEN